MEILRELFLDAASEHTGIAQMCLRALLVFVVGVALMRMGSRRFPGQNTPFDLLLAVVIGSVLSRTINGEAVFVTTVAACATLIAAHWAFAWISFHSHRFGVLIKGRDTVLVRDGEIDEAALDACNISERDLQSALRLRAGIEDVSRVRSARLERNGEISVVLGTPQR